jgi:WD40 repeat protein
VIQLWSLEAHTSHVWSIAVGMDGKIYSGSKDRTIKVWSGEDGTLLRTLVGHTDRVLALGWTATCTLGRGRAPLECGAATTVPTCAALWDTLRPSALWPWGSTAGFTRGRLIAQSECGEATTVRTVGHTDGVRALVWMAQSTLDRGTERSGCGVVMMVHTCAHLWDTQDMSAAWLSVSMARFTLEATTTESESGEVMMVRSCSPRVLQTLEGHTAVIRALVVGLDGTLFSASNDGTLMVWRVDNGALVHAHTVQCASVVNSQHPRNWTGRHAALWRRQRQCHHLVMAAM